ncbi:MAG: methyl-accepting chemotaxis protein [Myxococcota bacterium]
MSGAVAKKQRGERRRSAGADATDIEDLVDSSHRRVPTGEPNPGESSPKAPEIIPIDSPRDTQWAADDETARTRGRSRSSRNKPRGDRRVEHLEAQLAAIGRSLYRVELDLDGRIVSANERFLTGLDFDLEELSGRRYSSLVGPSQRDNSPFFKLWESLSHGRSVTCRVELSSRNGKRVWLDGAFEPVKGDDGTTQSFLHVAMNATAAVREAQEQAQAKAAVARQRAILDGVSTNILLTDEDFQICYANPASIETAKRLERHLKVSADELVGSSIDIFFSNSAQRAPFGRSKLPRNVTTTLGRETLDLSAREILTPEGESWVLVTWDVVTEKRALERRMAQVHSMVENAPTNCMYADLDLVIQYANPKSLETLRRLEPHLPLRADELVGSCIDVFHKRPEHQRRILRDPKNLPHRAQIALGPETLDLLVSPIYDHEGEYLGPMLTWEVITERIEAEQREKELLERERAQAEELRSKVDQMLVAVGTAASGDLSAKVDVSGEDAIGQLGEGLSGFLSNLASTVREMSGTSTSMGESANELLNVSQSMAATAEETSTQATVVSEAADQVSQNVSTVAAGVEELNASVKEIAQNAAEASAVATEGVSVAQTTNDSVSKLGESSRQIGKVIKVITSIAQQTNLLALNATIEAARAGEAGKGFAVVANEVKELAKETAKATEDIGQKIEAIQTDTHDAVTAIDRISDIISRVNEIQATIAAAVEEQTATTTEIARSVSEAARGSNEIAANISSVAEAAQTTAKGAASTQGAAEELGKLATEMEEMIQKFSH